MAPISPSATKSAFTKFVELSIKILITIVCFWYISTKIDFAEAWHSVLNADWWFLLIAILFYSISKIVSAFRLNINFRNIKVYLSEWENLKLYWLGMFYNLFLPGAISGDAYKVILLNRAYKAAIKKTSIAVLLDRFSGLLGLGALLSVYGILVIVEFPNYFLPLACFAFSVIIFYLGLHFFFKEFLPGFIQTLLLGIVVQALQVICIYFIMWSLQIPLHQSEWIFIFLASSAISVLPISLGGGLGTRELVFAEGASLFQLTPELGIVISLLFYFNNLICSFWGARFIFENPLKNTSKKALFKSE